MIELLQGTVLELAERIEFGPSLALTQTSDGVPKLDISAGFGVTQEEGDARWVLKTGDVMTGNLHVNSTFGFGIGGVSGARRIQYDGGTFELVEVSGAYANLRLSSLGVGVAPPGAGFARATRWMVDGGAWMTSPGSDSIDWYASSAHRMRLSSTQFYLVGVQFLIKDGSSVGTLYIGGNNYNTLNSGFSEDAEDRDIWINYRGYNDGFTRFRDFRVGDGKGNQVALFDGSSKEVTFATHVHITNGHFIVGGVGAGLFSSVNENYIFSYSASYWANRSANTTAGGFRFENSSGVLKGYVYWDSEGFGLLNDQGGWSVRALHGASFGGHLYGKWTVNGDPGGTEAFRVTGDIRVGNTLMGTGGLNLDTSSDSNVVVKRNGTTKITVGTATTTFVNDITGPDLVFS